MDTALTYAETHADQFVDELKTLLRIPSVSTDSAYDDEVERAAAWLADHLDGIGMEHTEIIATDGHPLVYAEHITDPAKPTVVVYGHYDVQPPDPLEEWDTDPFEPAQHDGNLYARGACDDKGQMFMHVKAAEAYLSAEGDLPVNLKYIIEGEEESGSMAMGAYVQSNGSRLGGDVVLISDTAMFSPDTPSITYGLRGLAYAEITLRGPNRDLHSGNFGGAVDNPCNALSRILAGLHDDDHRITIPGFYDDVQDLTEAERKTYAELPFDEQSWRDALDINAVRTEGDYTTLECLSARPTLDVNGIWGGYTDEGAKTVLPSRAHAKLSMRLVPDQQVEDVYDKLEAHLEAAVPDTMQFSMRRLHGGDPVLVDRSAPPMQAAKTAMGEVRGTEPVFVRNGGTIPVVADFQQHLGLDSVLMGFGLDSDAIHSPNEHFGLDRFQQGIQAIIRFHNHYAEMEA
ncbi:MAG: dipeptidase [Salinibacter sp.]|uniref:dipeptidase n=1 Tax=Salinibacter sp. TaxID=2065818 RepID=UPI002FC37106